MDVGGFFLDFGRVSGATGAFSESTGEVPRTAPASDRRRSYVAAGRQSMRRRHRRAPGRLELAARASSGVEAAADRNGRRRGGAQREDGVARQ